MKTYTHKDIEILFREPSADFVATVNGARVCKPSLDAMRKHIDDAAKVTFKPFDALNFWRDELTVFKVTGVQKTRNRFGDGAEFVSTQGAPTNVTPDTPSARDAIKAWQKIKKANEAAIARPRLPHPERQKMKTQLGPFTVTTRRFDQRSSYTVYSISTTLPRTHRSAADKPVTRFTDVVLREQISAPGPNDCLDALTKALELGRVTRREHDLVLSVLDGKIKPAQNAPHVALARIPYIKMTDAEQRAGGGEAVYARASNYQRESGKRAGNWAGRAGVYQ